MKIKIADTFTKRLIGLMFKKDIDYGLLFTDIICPSVHTSFMRFEIDIYFLDEHYTVVDKTTLKPWKHYKSDKKSRYILETKKDMLKIKIGDKLDNI